jgi:hypothetical protein
MNIFLSQSCKAGAIESSTLFGRSSKEQENVHLIVAIDRQRPASFFFVAEAGQGNLSGV